MQLDAHALETFFFERYVKRGVRREWAGERYPGRSNGDDSRGGTSWRLRCGKGVIASIELDLNVDPPAKSTLLSFVTRFVLVWSA